MIEKVAIDVDILGQDCQVMCSSPEEELRVQKTASLIREEVENIVRQAGVSQVTALLYTALNLGDRLFREIESTENLRDQITQGAEQIAKLERELHKKPKAKESTKARGKKDVTKDVLPKEVLKDVQKDLEKELLDTLDTTEESPVVIPETVEPLPDTVEATTAEVPTTEEAPTVQDAPTEQVVVTTEEVERPIETEDTVTQEAPQRAVTGFFETMASFQAETPSPSEPEDTQTKIPDC